jgi:hypothetical protein
LVDEALAVPRKGTPAQAGNVDCSEVTRNDLLLLQPKHNNFDLKTLKFTLKHITIAPTCFGFD